MNNKNSTSEGATRQPQTPDAAEAPAPSANPAPNHSDRPKEAEQTTSQGSPPESEPESADVHVAQQDRATEEQTIREHSPRYEEEKLAIQSRVATAAERQVLIIAIQTVLLVFTVVAALMAYLETRKATQSAEASANSARESVKIANESLAQSRTTLALTQRSVELTQDSVAAAQDSAQSARQSLEALNRGQSAWITIDSFLWERATFDEMKGYWLQPKYTNTGPTPAVKVINTTIVAYAANHFPYSEIKFPSPRERRSDSHTFVGPESGGYGMRAFIPSAYLVDSFVNGNTKIYVRFRFDYADIFGKQHATELTGILVYWGDPKALSDFSVPFDHKTFDFSFVGENSMN